MTMYNCWITYETDRSLQSRIKRGDFSNEGGPYIPITCLPAPSGNGACWPGILREWCRKDGVKFIDQGLIVSAKVKKQQIENFIQYVYADDPSYSDPAKMLTWKGRAYLANSLTNLRAFVAKELNSRLWYEIKADEY